MKADGEKATVGDYPLAVTENSMRNSQQSLTTYPGKYLMYIRQFDPDSGWAENVP